MARVALDSFNPIASRLERNETLLLDGGLATELERAGRRLDSALWSARCLIDAPDELRAIHESFYLAGADVLLTATYQAAPRSLRRAGVAEDDLAGFYEHAVQLARVPALPDREPPLVAASAGPYGAALGDGSEYRGDYSASPAELIEFHGERLALLAGTSAALVAFETIPSASEVRAILQALRSHPRTPAWLSFSCRDTGHLADGTPIEEVAAPAQAHPQIVALGVNCLPPENAGALLKRIGSTGSKPLLAYPNSGETFDPGTRRWMGSGSPEAFAQHLGPWLDAGCRLAGGCCRTGPEHLAALRQALELRAKP